MYLAKACPCCGSVSHKTYAAVVAPFVAEYVLGGRDTQVNLLACLACDFRWFDQRFEPVEMAKLYIGYRGQHYLSARQKHEPWYSTKVNDSHGSEEEISDRTGTTIDFMAGVTDLAQIESILDYGGDKGQFIPPGLGKQRYVYEVSGVDAVAGVSVIADEKSLSSNSYDLVMVAHVLEHLPNPSAELEVIRPLLKSRDSLLYVEVPHERYDLRWVGSNGLYGAYLGALKAVPFALLAGDFYSTAFRVKFGVVPPLGFVKMHEHVNFFSEKSLSALLARSGYDVVKSEVRGRSGPTGEDEILYALARSR